MQVQNWMSTDVVTVDKNTPVIEVMKILEENNIRHVPVMSEGKLVGMITDQEIKEASPSKATAMKAQELYSFLATMKAKDVMQTHPVSIKPGQTMEVAAVKMIEYRVTGLPVVTEKGALVGIISQGDVFRVLISITGIYQGGIQFAFNLEERAGSIKEVADVIRQEKGQIVSILSTSETADEGYRHVFIRFVGVPESRLKTMIKRFEKDFMLLYVIDNPLKDL